ncbi:hypothetical protein C1280_11345 [Gemmata obscuriglobus]|uniref:Uncharacterized protein n=1 Tax=Gemmata obscuriglobus TaxID=114 RepID=A0A2Z3H910_9BACT|nr:hypothetical protein C1280_11345 [Gemmata obscuriglobus]
MSHPRPNPALHLTPPSVPGRIAHPMMAVQVSCSFGRRREVVVRAADRRAVVRLSPPPPW